MSDKHFGVGRTNETNFVTQNVSGEGLPLASHLAQQELLKVCGQGGLINSTSNGISEISNHTAISPMKRKLPHQETVSLRRKLSETEVLKITKLQTDYAEKCAIHCFLNNNGQPADYSAWRKQLPPVPLVNFLKLNKLNPEDDKEDLYSVLRNSPSTQKPAADGRVLSSPSGMGQLAEKKRVGPGVRSVKCPTPEGGASAAAAAATSTPIKEEGGSEIGSPAGSGAATPTTPTTTTSTTTTTTSQEQIVERAKQEAYVMQRIGELQRDGLWAEKRLPKVYELPRPKAHWDFLLEEMVWLAADFAQERKWKKAAAKKCARMVQKYFQEKEANAQKAVKAREIQLKRIASCMAKEVKQFWSNVQKLVEFKQQTRLEEKRKKALDEHLSFIVDQTERYSSLVAESMNTSVTKSPSKHSDVEFEPEDDSDDDEETIAKEEAMLGDEAVSAEIEALQRESELPLEDLLSDYLNHRDSIPEDQPPPSPSSTADTSRQDDDDDDPFQGSGKETSDDEETIQEQEEAEGSQNHKEELNELEADNNLSIEALKEKYKVIDSKSSDVVGNSEKEVKPLKDEKSSDKESSNVDSDDDDEEEVIENEAEVDEEDDEEEEDEEEEDEEEEMEVDSDKEEDSALKSLFSEEKKQESSGDKDQEINDVAAIAQSLQPKGNTLSSTNVVTKVPFLLKHKLREYQHIGLDWLVTMYERNLNGILADEMGLGKTIQTISLLSHLACEKGNWGPHLIVVPTSVMLNWEMEFKKWCPAFKILTYYGSIKERRLKRIGWTKPNAFHVCITSYKLIIQDHQSFRRKKWKYLILDEAQNIKNFKSQRWQLLLNFQTQRRLLLTGTPLQNNLMELWSLMHFLMPSVFESHREFKEWFSNPVTGMIEGNSDYNENIIKRLHKVLRPFLLRRLKCEVETQMPKKYEHVVMCRLSNRQRYLYDDFMSRAKTRETLATGNLLSVINVLMQLRKVCNHPNLFEVRPTVSPFQMEPITFYTASIATTALDYEPFKHVNLNWLNLMLVNLEYWLLAFVAHRARRYKTNRKLIEEIDTTPLEAPPKCPRGKIKISVQRRNCSSNQTANPAVRAMTTVAVASGNNHRLITGVTKVGTSPVVKPLVGQSTAPIASNQAVTLRFTNPAGQIQNYIQLVQQQGAVKAIPVAGQVVKSGDTVQAARIVPQIAQIVSTPTGKQLFLSPQLNSQAGGAATATVVTSSGQRLTVVSKQGAGGGVARLISPAQLVTSGSSPLRPVVRVPPLNIASLSQPQTQSFVVSGAANPPTTGSTSGGTTDGGVTFAVSSPMVTRQAAQSSVNSSPEKAQSEKSPYHHLKDEKIENIRRVRRKEKLRLLNRVNEARCEVLPIYGVDVISSLRLDDKFDKSNWKWTGGLLCNYIRKRGPDYYWKQTEALSSTVLSLEDRVEQLSDVFTRYVMYVPAVSAPRISLSVSHPPPSKAQSERHSLEVLETAVKPLRHLLHPISSGMATLFPDPRLIQYDCGKLQALDLLLRQLKTDHHRALIFTQMTRMLDVLEAFLNHHGHIYLRLDGTTKVEQRQVLMERFNNDRRIFCFILSTRSGGVGVNLTGADTVIFYDSDWNPTMDAQAQDRCHRIGQTRDVHIYRLISEKTVEENILKKANQKRMLGDLAIEGGNFTTAYFKSTTIQDIFNVDVSENDPSRRMAEVLARNGDKKDEESSQGVEDVKGAAAALETALAQAEDESDVAAAKVATAEAAAELAEFDENIPIENAESQEQLSKAELELQALVQQLNGVEKYAMRFLEEMDSCWVAEQMAAAEAQLEEQKREWEASQAKAREERKRKASSAVWSDEETDEVTYSGADSRNQEWMSNNCELMPMWCPPTPPQGDSDVYIDESLCLLYERHVIPDANLPPIFVAKERKRPRLSDLHNRLQVNKMRQKEENIVHAPRSLFDRPTPAVIKMRQELRLQRIRGIGMSRPLSSIHSSLVKPPLPVKPVAEPEHVPDWVIHEDWAILQAIQHVQEMTLNLVVLSPAHTPNWDMVAHMVNMSSRTYRSPKQCRNRYESVIVPREEGKLILDSPKKLKKNKTFNKLPQMKSGRPLRTSQLFQQDNNLSMTQVMCSRFEAIRSVSNRRAPTVKPLLVDPAMKNPKHAEVLADSHIDYEAPLTPIEVAAKRADRIAKEKLAQQGGSEQQLAVVRQHQIQNVGKANTPTATSRQLTTLTVQEMAVTVGGNRTVVSTSSAGGSGQQKSATPSSEPQSPSSAPSSPQTTPKGTKTISAAQLALYRQQQAALRQQQLKLLARSQQATTPPPKVPIAVSAPNSPAPRIQQVKCGSVGRPVTESEMVAILKRQQVATKVATSTPSLTTAQILTGIQMKGVTAAGKAGVSTQQMRQLALQQQLVAAAVAQQRNAKLGGQQKVIGQVKGGGTQLITVQSAHKPTTMTVHQIHQVMKQVHPQQLVVTTGGATRTAVPTVSLDNSTRQVLPVKTTTAHQAILTQVSAVLGGGQPITVRQPVRIQQPQSTVASSTTSAAPIVAVPTSPTTLITIPTSTPADSTQSQHMFNKD